MTRRRVRPAGLVGLAVLWLLWSGGAPAGARPSGLAHGPVEAATQSAPSLELVRQTTWVHPGEAYTVDVRVTGAPAGATLDLVVHDLLGSRAEFRETLDGELGGTEHAVAPQALDALTTSPGVAQIGFTPGPGGVSLPSRGVYPVELRLRSGGQTVASTVTYLTYLTPGDFPPLEVGVVVEIAAPPALQPDGATELSPESSTRARERVEAVEAAGTTPLTLAPLPETVEGLADAGGADAALVDRLRQLAATRQVLARPFVDIDLASLQDARLESEAYAQSDAGANVARSRLAVEPAGGVWLSGATWSPEAARWAVEIAFDRAIVPATAVGDGDGEDIPTTPVRLGDDGPLAVVTDPDLADHLTSDDGMVAAHRFIAELTTAWLERPSDPRAMVVQIPPDADIDPEVVGTALAALNDGQAVQGVPVTQIFTDVPPADDGTASVDLAPAERGPDLRSLAPRIESVRGRISGVAGLLDDPSVQTSLDHALFMSTGVATPDADRAAYVDWVEAELQTVTGAVSLPDEFRITLTARSSTIPVTLTNNTEQDLQVRVELDSDQLEFPDGDVLTPTLPPGTTRLEVRVRARTSGAFTLDVTVSSPDDTLVLDRSTFDIRSTAISGVGLLLSVGAGLFLAIWWGRNWRRTSRARRKDGAEPPPPAGVGLDSAPSPARTAADRTTSSIAPWAAPACGSHASSTPSRTTGRTPRAGAASGSDGPGRGGAIGPGRAVPSRPHGPLAEPQQHAWLLSAAAAVGADPRWCRASLVSAPMPVRIVTDSAADLPTEEATRLGVEVVPLSIRFGAEEFTDGVDLSVTEFYEKLASSDTLPETSAPSPGAFEAAYRRQAEAGADAVVCINLSEGLSATIQSARNAATAVAGDLDVRVIDSRSITAGLGTQVTVAADAAADGASADEVVALVEGMVPRTHVIGALDTLENLKKGGRIGGAQALLGSLLSIKPLLDISTGEVAEAGKARTRRKALEWLRDQLFAVPQVEHLCVAHGGAPDVDDMLALLAPRYPEDTIRVTTIGATIGTHGGPRVMGLTWVDPA